MRPRNRTRRRPHALMLSLLLAGLALPGCGEAMEEHEEESIPHSAEVTLSAEQAAAAAIDSFQVAARPLNLLVHTTAVIEPVPDLTAQIPARVAGQVISAQVNVGDRVQRGQLLGAVDAPELGRAKADFLAALADETVALQTVAREQRLFADRITSERRLREAEGDAIRAVAEREAAEARLHTMGLTDADLRAMREEQHYDSRIDLRSPIAGTVTARTAIVGASVSAADALFTVMDLSRVWIHGDLFDTQLQRVRVGQSVIVRTPSYPDRRFEGRVEQIGPVVEPATRSVQVRVTVRNDDLALMPGMFANLEISSDDQTERAIVVPRDAVQRDGAESIVFVVAGPNRFVRRVVRIGAESGEWVAIAEGVVEGEWVVSRGAFILKAEYRRAELGEGGAH